MSESDLPAFAQATSGAMGSLVSNTLVYPLDLLSTRLQTQSRSRASSAKAKKAESTLVGALKEIVKTSGVGGLYQGLGSDSLSNTLSNFLFFYFRGFLMEFLHKRHDRLNPTSGKGKDGPSFSLSPAQDLAVGALAGTASRFFTTPLSNVTVRKQTNSSVSSNPNEKEKGKSSSQDDDDSSDDEDGEYGDGPSILDILKEIVREKGPIGLWSGFETAALLSVTPALTFSFTTLFTRLLPKSSQESPSAIQTFITSAGGNALSTFLLFPLILSKTRLQWKSPSGKKIYKNLIDVLKKTVKRNGIKGLYQGLESQLVKGLIGHGMTMMVKQRVEELFIMVFLVLRDRARRANAIKA